MKKREIFRRCFENFDYEKIAAYGEEDVWRILGTEGMLKSERKIRAVIGNARCYREIREEFGSFCAYLWNYTDGKTILYAGHAEGKIPVGQIPAIIDSGDRTLAGKTMPPEGLYLNRVTYKEGKM